MADRMTQSQLIKELAEKLGVTSKQAKEFITTYAEIMVRETKKAGEASLPGIGKLVRQERKARTGRNPATGATIKIPAKKVVKFRVAKAVKDAIVPPKKKYFFSSYSPPVRNPPREQPGGIFISGRK
ncbi:MAG: HU family DNA-binding protein [Acidobacteriota bacterium]